MRVLVTGAAGFIGSHYVRTLLGDDGYRDLGGTVTGDTVEQVTVLDALTYAGNRANLDPVADDGRLRFVEGDIRDPDAVAAALEGQDVVLNFAAETHVDRSISGAAPFVTTNVVGVQVLCDAARAAGVRRLLHVSTDEVYGSISQGSATEDSPLNPSTPYSAAKTGGDLVALAYTHTYGLDVVVTRCTNNYGPYHFPEKVIPLFVTNLLDGHDVPLYGEGLNVRDWLHVDDHCRGVHLALERGTAGTVYNIGGGTELTNRELTERLLAATGRDWSSVRQVEDRLGHDLRYSLDDSRLRGLGYAPRTPFDTGLAAVVDWYRHHRDWWEPLKERAGLPSGPAAAAAEAGPAGHGAR